MKGDVEYPPNCAAIPCSSGNSELVRKLKILSEALQVSDTNEECGQPDRYRTLICHLAQSCFLENSSKDVQIWLACCLADILRVFAPNVPLGDPSQLRNISVVSTLVLALELPPDDASQVIRMLLKTSMEIANGKEWKSEARETSEDGSATEDDGDERSDSRDKVIGLLIGMISKLLRDVDQVSAEVLDVLFFYLINPQKLNNRESYNMSRQIIQVSQTSLEAIIQSLLTQSLLSGTLPEECELVGSGRKKLHDVILELHEVAPELVAPVLPQLSCSLLAEDDNQRLLAAKLVGKLVSSGKSRFYDEHPKLWKNYLERFKDTSSDIREVCARDSHEILLRHSQLRGQISSALGSLTRDLDDGVRLTAVLCIIETARKKLEAVNESLIMACCDRMKDKKPKIRQEAITKLLHLYFKIIMGEEHTASDVAAVTVIPKKALAVYMLASMTEEKSLIERYFSSYIIPYRMEMKKRVKSMVDLFSKLDNFEAQVFAEIISRSSSHRRVLREMLQIISRQAATELQSKIQRISTTHHDPIGSQYYKASFARAICPNNGIKVTKELIQRSMEAGTIPKDCQNNIRRYVERVAPLIMDLDSTVELLNVALRMKNDAECGNVEAISKLPYVLRLVKIWSEAFPHIFSRGDAIDCVLKLVVSDDAKTGMIVWDVILCDSDGFGRCCKLAARVICRLLGKEECATRFDQLYPEIEERVSKANPAACVNALRVISELHRDLPQVFGPRVKKLIAEFVVPGLILSYERDPEDVDSFDPFTPLEEQSIPKYCLSKVYGMKLLARYLFTCGGDAEDDSLAMKTLKMFVAFIQAAGDLHDPDKNISAAEKAWLRAVAGTSLLKLCYIQKYSHMMGADIVILQDDADCVRGYFVRRLNKGISRNRLTIEYLSFFSLVALIDGVSTEEENAVKLYVVYSFNMYLPYHQPEYAIAYAAWLLSHQEILSTHSDIANMAILQECLWFIMEPFVAKKENTDFEFIYRLLQDIKESNDALFEKRQKQGEIGEAELIGQNKKMWVLADLGMLMLVYRGKVSIRNEPRKTLLSSRFFVREKDSKHAGTVYAPHELIEDEKERNGKLPTRDRKRLNATSNTTASKRAAREPKDPVKTQRGRVPSVKLNKIDESPTSPDNISPPRKRMNRKPLKVEQQSVVDESNSRNKQSVGSPTRSPVGVQGLSTRRTTRNRATKEKEKEEPVKASEIMANGDDETSPSTSREQPQTRSVRSQRTPHQSPNTKLATPTKANVSPLKRNSRNEEVVTASSNGDLKNPTWSKKRHRSSLNNFDDVADLSPITRSGEKITRSRSSNRAPLSTSTPMPSTIPKSPKRSKLLRGDKTSSVQQTQATPEKEKEKSSKTSESKTRTRSQQSRASNGSISSTSPVASQKSIPKTKTAPSLPKSPLRPKRTQRVTGKAK
ncbi:HEAT repeat protein [Ancylostoma ceylanicum]|uniref:HEAT repeat protein n=1 Tax=Ancylostoma ceylanicum TaxID=53326 RepID=A0A0D6LTM7_9BILA|nr:HEAT repeat protein [Ancylostoma ceylanicum]